MARKPTHAHEADNGLAEKILSGDVYPYPPIEVNAEEGLKLTIDQRSLDHIRARIFAIEAYLIHLGKTMGHNGTPQFTPHGESDD